MCLVTQINTPESLTDAEPAPMPSSAANGPQIWGAIHTWTIGEQFNCNAPNRRTPAALITPALVVFLFR